MKQQVWINRIAAFWLCVVLGVILSPARSFADCHMNDNGTVAAGQVCCVKGSTCACAAAGHQPAQGSAAPLSGRIECRCTVEPQPENSAPQTAPLRLYVAVALPTRAGPAFPVSLVPVSLQTISLPIASHRFVPPSPPRAPPF
jgi:hypothetical protein